MSRPRIRLSLRSRIIAAATLAAVALGTVSGTAMLGPDSASPGADSAVEAAAPAGDATTSTTAAAGTDDDAAGDAEESDDFVITGTGGEVGGGGSLDFASAISPVAPVDLDPVEPFAPKPEAPKDPATVDALAGPAGGPAQDLVSNAKGCAAGCIESALLHRQIRKTDVRFTIKTDRRAKIVAEISTQPPVYNGGIPSLPGAVQMASAMPRVRWQTTFEGLAPDTKYYFLVRATDGGGNTQHATTSFRTVKPIGAADDLAANPAGCSYQCISVGRADLITDSRASLHVETSTPAVLTVAVSTQEPGWVGGSPILPAEIPVSVPAGLAQARDIPIGGLAPKTTYHVVVRATDAEGRFSSRVGRFTTAEAPPVEIAATLRKIHVVSDGDPGALGDGEISFAWGVGDKLAGGLFVASYGDGDEVNLTPSNNTQRYKVNADGFLPPIHVSGTEFDKPKQHCPNVWVEFAGLHTVPDYDSMCRRRTNVASTHLIKADLGGLLSCKSYGAIGDWEDDACVIIHTEDLGKHYPRYWALISFSG